MIARLALRFTDWAETWLPDAFVFALLATLLVLRAGSDRGARRAAGAGRRLGQGLLGALALHDADGPRHRDRLRPRHRRGPWRSRSRGSRALPRTARQAVVLVALFAMVTSWLNWGFTLIFGALLAREVARHRPEADYRALAASSFLGLGSVWAQGLSSSAALQMATPGALQPKHPRHRGGGRRRPGRRHPAAGAPSSPGRASPPWRSRSRSSWS